MNAGTVSDGDVMLQQCHREIALLEYLLKSSEYDREMAEERVQYNERVQKDIMEADDERGRLVDSLENSSEDSLGKKNQHTDVLIVEENSEQHTEVLAKEDKALMPSDFYSNKCFVNAGIVAEHLTQLSSQMKEEEVFCSRRQEGMDDWVAVRNEKVRTETSKEARSQQVTVHIEKVKTEQAVLAQQAARNQQPGYLLDQEIESIKRLMMKESRKRPVVARKKRKDNKRKTAKDCKSRASGALQHKIWNPGGQQQLTTTVKELTSKERLQNKIWDPGGNIQTYDQVVMNFLTWGV